MSGTSAIQRNGLSIRSKWLISVSVAAAALVIAAGSYLYFLHAAFCSEGSCSSQPPVATTTTWAWDGHEWSLGIRQQHVGGLLGRGDENLAFDPGTGQLVLVADSPDSHRSSNSTWIWSGSGWSKSSATAGEEFPGTLVYDSQDRHLLMINDQSVFAWSGTSWGRTGSLTGPGEIPVAPEPVAYDPQISSVVTIDRNCSGSGTAKTFVLHNYQWSALTGADLPSWGDLAYDPARAQLVLFGDAECQAGTSSRLCPAETWTFDGTKWAEKPGAILPIVNPAQPNCWEDDTWRMNRMAYDPDSEHILLLGSSQLWEWDGTTWSVVSADLPADLDPTKSIVAYDDRQHKLVVVSTSCILCGSG